MCPRPRRFAIDRASMRDPGVGWRRATWWLVLCGLAAVRVVVAQGDCGGKNMTEDSSGNCLCEADTFPVVYERELFADNEYGVKDTRIHHTLNDLEYTYGGTNRLAFGRNDTESLYVLGGLWVGINAFRFNITAETGQVYAAQNHNNTDVCINTDMNKERLSARHAISVSDDGNIAFVAGEDNGHANLFRVQRGFYYKLNPSGHCGGGGTILMKVLPLGTQEARAAACAAACISRDTPYDSNVNGWEGKESWVIESFSISNNDLDGHCTCLHAPISDCSVQSVNFYRYDFTDYDQCDTLCREIRIHNPVVSLFFTGYELVWQRQQKFVVDVMVSGSNLQVLWRSAIYTGIDIFDFRGVWVSKEKLHQQYFITNPDIPAAMSSTPSISNVTYVAVNHKLYTADTTDPTSFAFTHVSAVTVNISDLAFSRDGALLYTLEVRHWQQHRRLPPRDRHLLPPQLHGRLHGGTRCRRPRQPRGVARRPVPRGDGRPDAARRVDGVPAAVYRQCHGLRGVPGGGGVYAWRQQPCSGGQRAGRGGRVHVRQGPAAGGGRG
jgi:hypothetical protein